MGAQPIRIDFEGTTHEFPPDFSQQDIQKALLMFHGSASGSQPGLVSIEGQPTGVKITPSDDEERLAAFKQLVTSGKERSVSPQEAKASEEFHTNHPIAANVIDILHSVGDPSVAVPGGGMTEGLGGKIADLFQALKNRGVGLNSIGMVSPRARYTLKTGQGIAGAIKDIISGAPEEWEPFRPNPKVAKKMKYGGPAED